MIDPYKILGVSESAAQDEIKKAYKNLARKFHPDKNPGNAKAEEKFKEVNEAYQLIGDAESRKKYDQGGFDEDFLRNNPFEQGNFHFSFDDLDSGVFENIFKFARGGRGAQFGSGQRAQPSIKGQDILYEMDISLHEAINGSKRAISLSNGKKLEINIPSGISEGQKLKLKGQGGPGMGGAPNGDLLIQMKIHNTTEFERKGNNLYKDVNVPLETAILGGELTFESFNGPLSLTIPPYTSSGKKMRLKGKGVPGKGDLIIRLQIELPKERQEELQQMFKTTEV